MDFPGDDRPAFLPTLPSSSGIPDGYFLAQALHAGYFDIAGDIQRADVSAREVLQRELLKERIRGEIILREVARVRVLEEEIRRELEMERAMAMRRRCEELASSFGGAPEVSEERVLYAHVAPEVGFERGRVVASAGGSRSDGEKLFGDRMVGVRFPTNVPQMHHEKKSTFSAVSPNLHHEKKSTFSAVSPNAKPSSAGLGGIKRIASELPGVDKKAGGPAEKDWSCALCRVSTTSREALNEHLEGKKHKGNAVLMGIVKNAGGSTSAKGDDKASTVTKSMDPKESLSSKKGKRPLMKATELRPPQKQQKTETSWCELCKVVCNSKSALASHLGGKKHRTMSEKSQSAAAKAAAEKKMAVEIQSSEAIEEVKAKSASMDEGTGIVEDCKVGEPGTC